MKVSTYNQTSRYDHHSHPYHNSYYDGKQPYAGDIKRGDIFFFDKGQAVGTEMHGGRPGIIVSADTGRYQGDNVLVVYTTTAPKSDMPTHVKITSTNKESTALCEQIHTLSTKKISKYCGHVTDEEMLAINEALKISVGIPVCEMDYHPAEIPKQVLMERDMYKQMYNDLLNKVINKK